MPTKHQLPDLPYPSDALAPHISAETLSLHHGKHHATYVDKLNGLIDDTPFADARLSEIVVDAEGGIFNNGAQAWNHAYYVDYRNRKKEYVDTFWKLVNWEFVAQNLTRKQPFDV